MTPPSDLSALIKRADDLAAKGERAGAIRALETGLQRVPAHFEGWLVLSRHLFEAKRYEHAIKAVQFAEQLDPLTADFQTIQNAIQKRDYAAAEQAASSMLERIAGHPRAIFTLAHLAQAHGDFERALEVIAEGLLVAPANLTLRTMQITALEQAGRYREALSGAETLTRIASSAQSLWSHITVLMRYGQNEAALAACDRLLPMAGSNTGQKSAVELVRAQVLRILGQREDSIAAFRACLELNPRNATAWWGLADLKTYQFTDADRAAMTGLLAAPGIDPLERSLAAFGLAKAEETSAGTAEAMASYHRANQLHPAHGFDLSGFEGAIASITQQVTTKALERRASPPEDAAKPIFIIGLPRSGSTLVEQILASHSAVEGTIEQPTLPALKRRAHAYCAQRLGGDYLSKLGDIPQEELSALGESYLSESQLFRPEGAANFTDKLPHNFEHVGLIAKILPHAAIIDVRRNPMDCGYSLYKQHFTQGTEFSYKLENIGRYFNGYLKLMDHWDQVLPGRVFHLQYEDLVADPEPVVRALLDHIGLAFEPACLNFHENQRAVRTASSEQVRQPLNAKGVGAWKGVEAELEPLKAALGADTLKRFEAYL